MIYIMTMIEKQQKRNYFMAILKLNFPNLPKFLKMMQKPSLIKKVEVNVLSSKAASNLITASLSDLSSMSK